MKRDLPGQQHLAAALIDRPSYFCEKGKGENGDDEMGGLVGVVVCACGFEMRLSWSKCAGMCCGLNSETLANLGKLRL